ncbi:MAG: WxL domain-containing protein [Lactobacillales bacterium]|jgi:hypothetical protein|nr:WxL domain-containing protein [Lactobacillales bacterium]
MKKELKGLMGALLVAGILAPAVTFAAEGKTDGTIKFEKMDSIPGIIVPDSTPPEGPDSTPDDSLPTPDSEPTVTVEGVSILHAPSFDFNIHKISNQTKNYYALFDFVSLAATPTSDGALKAIPSFLQVADFSGDVATVWKVTVHQDYAFTAADSTDNLPFARVHVNAMNVMNNLIPVATFDAAYGTTGGKLSGDQVVPIGTGGDLVVLDNSNPDKHIPTNGTITSAVFNAAYVDASHVKTVTQSLADLGITQAQVNAATIAKGVTEQAANDALRVLVYGSATGDMTNADDGPGIINKLRSITDGGEAAIDAYENENVWLNVDRNDRPQAKRYNTSFTWTLTATV